MAVPLNPTSTNVPPTAKPFLREEIFSNFKITIIGGEPGAGKTWYCIHHKDRRESVYFDLEDKYNIIVKELPELAQFIQIYYPLEQTDMLAIGGTIQSCRCKKPATHKFLLGKTDQGDLYGYECDACCQCNVFTCKSVDKNMDTDPVQTMLNFEKKSKEIFTRLKPPKVIFVDGISDIRRYYADIYCVKHNSAAVYGAGPWGEVNDDTKKAVFRLINFARLKKIGLVMTCWLVDEYTDGDVKTKNKKLDIKEFVVAQTDETLAVRRQGTEYQIKRVKGPRGSTDWTQYNLT